MATKLDKCASHLNDMFAETLKRAFAAKFNRELKTHFNIFEMALVSKPADGRPYTKEQKAWVMVFDDGYSAAMTLVRALAWEDEQRKGARG